ncbi:Hypothetical protein PHPALM_19588 [Phytophthora palmivora]|uniref:PiggyBac transposable element-derived protein domain-containing protein n=1 Tax=Phytophthora palmivora TaxID=4796 RepID=A0A2P4XH09_9STRA|nr:Hypothetical protein PHPALM_19588 [Phytophthora palmivora]
MAMWQTGRHRESAVQITRRLKATQLARMLCPQKRRFSAHLSMDEDGAIPVGRFGRYMTRKRCHRIMHHGRDKLWKLRPVKDTIQERFLVAWHLPAVFSFGEGVLPATSMRDTTCLLMADMPHRYGSKLFILYEVYVGKRNNIDGDDKGTDFKAGPAAVVRNLKCALTLKSRHNWHAVAIDRYYSSVLLAVGTLKMDINVVGAITTNRLGFNKSIKLDSKPRPESIPRGSFVFSRSVPTMISFLWWDRKPCFYLCTGFMMTVSTIERKLKRVGALQIKFPKAVNDYQNWIGGVDRGDQLRLQRYSLKMSTRFTKYYKGLLLGLLDLALVSGYLSHKEAARIKDTVTMKRLEWFSVLQNQLRQLKAEDFSGVQATTTLSKQKRKRAPVCLTKALQHSEAWVTFSGVQKRCQRSCKVWAKERTDKKKSFATTYFCERCFIDDVKCWLCIKIRRDYNAVAKTCLEIWHDDFGAGQDIPTRLGNRVVLRRPGKNAGKRRMAPREYPVCRGKGSDGGDSGGGDMRKQNKRTMVRPLGKALRDSEVTGRDLSFKSPPPRRSVGDRYFYIGPGGSTTGSEGVHLFRGEEAALEYYANVLRSRTHLCGTWGNHSTAPGDAQIAAAAEVDDNLNAMDGGASGHFESIGSGDEAEKDDVETGEYDSSEDVEVHCLPEDVSDDPEETEAEIALEVLFAEIVLQRFGGKDQVLAGNLTNPVLRSMTATGWEDVEDIHEHLMSPYEPVDDSRSYPGLRQNYSGPTAETLRHGDSPHIATCSNGYHLEMLSRRIDDAYQRCRKKQRRNPDLPRKTRRDVQHEMETMKPTMPHELCRFKGLLVARRIAPKREKLANHWKTTDVGVILRGSFDSIVSRDRFMEISRNLHFNSNGDPRAQTDRAWKIRKVVEVLQRTFFRGYISPAHLVFDEAVLPSRSSFNKMRVYLKDKPHKWGTKLFMLWSAVTSFEVYCGMKQHASDTHKPDTKCGPAAVVRNLLEVLGEMRASKE